jgi:hypothetical protein
MVGLQHSRQQQWLCVDHVEHEFFLNIKIKNKNRISLYFPFKHFKPSGAEA